ncbi:MAG: hypothetical protein SNI70_06950 [Rikenellaceae bacterium]
MRGDDFFGNLRESDDAEFELPSVGRVPSTAKDVVQSLAQEKGANNINITITINKALFSKIESIQKEIQSKSGNKISKSKVITKICDQFLENYNSTEY